MTERSFLKTQRPAQLLLLGPLALAGGLLCGYVVVQNGFAMGLVLLLEALFVAAVMAHPLVGVLGTVAVIYLLPFGVNPIPFGAFHPTFLDVSLSVTLLSWSSRLLLRRDQGLVITPTIMAALFFLGMATVSLLFGLAWTDSERLRFFLKLVNSVLLAVTVLNVLRSRRDILLAARILVLAAGVAAWSALALYALPATASRAFLTSLAWLGYPAGGEIIRYIADTTTLRAVGTAVDPNVLGGMLMIALPLVLSQLLDRRPTLPRALLIVLAGSIGLALLLTYSRSAWLGAAVGVGVLGLLGYRRVWGLAGLAALALLVLPQGRAFIQRLLSGFSFADRAAQMRLGEYQDALQVISEYPVFGAGFGVPPEIDLYVAASSIYLLLGEQTGLLGLGAFLLSLAIFFWEVTRTWGTGGAHELLSINKGALAGVVGALCAGLFDHYFMNVQFPHTVALLWFFIGLTLAVTRAGESGSSS